MKKYVVVSCLAVMAVLLTGCGLIRTRMMPPPSPPSEGATVNTPSDTSAEQDSGTVPESEGQAQNPGVASGGSEGQTQTPGTVDLEGAKAAALRHAGLDAASVTFTKAQQDYDDGRVEYEIEFVTDTTRYEYEIWANDGAVKEWSQEPIQHISPNLQTQGTISVEDACAAALAAAQVAADQAVFTEIEMDYDDGVTQYEVEFAADGREYSITINAANGEVLEMEMD